MTMEQLTIQYKGMASQPSDYLVEDGNLNMAVNLEMRDGSLHAARVPRGRWFHHSEFTPRFIHNTSDGREIVLGIVKEYEVVSPDGEGSSHTQWTGKYTIGACDITGDRDTFKLDIENAPVADNVGDFKSFCAIGNLICFIVNRRIHVAFHKLGKYVFESSTPTPILKFSAHLDYKDVSTRNNVLTKNTSEFKRTDFEYSRYYNIGKATDDIHLKLIKTNLTEYAEPTSSAMDGDKASDYFFAQLNSLIKEKLSIKEFIYPRVIRYALRTYTGDYAWISPRIIVYPVRDSVYFSDIQLRATTEANWFASAIRGKSMDDIIANNGYITQLNKLYILCNTYKLYVDFDEDYFKELSNSTVWAGVDIFISEDIVNHKSKYVYGRWQEKNGGDYGYLPTLVKKTDEQIKRDVLSCPLYLLKSVTFDELIKLNGGNLISDDNVDTLHNITSQQSLDESMHSYSEFRASCALVYNSRLVIADVSRIMPDLAGMDYLCTPIYWGDFFIEDDGKYAYQQKYDKDNGIGLYKSAMGTSKIALRFTGSLGTVQHVESLDVGYIPLLLTYNMNYNAESGEVFFVNDSKAISVPIKNNMDGVGFAYYYADAQSVDSVSSNIEAQSVDVGYTDEIKYQSQVKESEVNNPLIYKDGNSITCGNGKVKVVAANTQPISQGQFGQYPIFAFCSDGVYAIGVGGNGTIQNCVPYSTDVITDAVSLCNVGRDIVFVSRSGVMSIGDEGRKMLLSADRNATYAFDDVKQRDAVHAVITNHYPAITVPSMDNLYKYLTGGARIAFDYQNRRLIVFNPQYAYSYLMDMDTQQWTVLTRKFTDHLNPVAQCLMVDADKETVYDYSTDDVQQEMAAWLSTRAIKLGAPDLHKTIRTMIQRGQLHGRDAVGQLLYGSRDMINWYPIRSSITSVMRGFGGSGYKYFRVFAFLPQMTQKDSLYGCSVGFDLRMTSRMR